MPTRLPGARVPERDEADSGARPRRDRQALGSSHGLRRPAQTLDRRTHIRSAAADVWPDWECLNHKALAFLRLASIRLMLRKLCNPA
jgi:hypothetical protein